MSEVLQRIEQQLGRHSRALWVLGLSVAVLAGVVFGRSSKINEMEKTQNVLLERNAEELQTIKENIISAEKRDEIYRAVLHTEREVDQLRRSMEAKTAK